MKCLEDGYLMMIEPENPHVKPISDDLARKAHDLLAITVNGTTYKGWHTCVCGAHSGACDLVLPDGTITNSLLVHYVECHRSEIPRSELAKLLIAHKEFCENGVEDEDMEIKEKLMLLKSYYELNRQVGHTSTMLNGVRNTEGAVVIADNPLNSRFLRNVPDPPLSSNQVRLLGNDLRSMNRPIALDNATVYSLCCEALKEIERLEQPEGIKK